MATPMEYVSVPDDLPELFKIYHPEICYPQLDLAVRSWKAVVEKKDGDFFFMESCPNFVLENNLEFGDFLTFSYAGHSKFYVKIYEINGSLRQDVTALKEAELLPLEEENEQEKGIVAQLADQTLDGSRDLVASVTSCEVIIKASHLTRAHLNLPAAFGNRFLKREQPLVATLRIGSASWRIIVYCFDRFELRNWMCKFIADNALHVNDVCQFKLIDDEKLILEVCIMIAQVK